MALICPRGHYLSAADSVWDTWSDSDIHEWLVSRGYLDERTASEKKRDDLVNLINSKYVFFMPAP